MIQEKAHAVFSASSSERWLECPGSIKLSDGIPNVSSRYADEGTKAHEALECFLKAINTGGQDAGMFQFEALMDDVRVGGNEYNEEMLRHAWSAAQLIHESIPPGAELLCETKVSLEFVRPGMFGTVDAAIVEQFGTLVVTDFKYGAGIPVEVKGNVQMIYYALGIARKFGFMFEKVRLRIIQPRAEHRDGPDRSHEMSIDELQKWTDTFGRGVDLALSENPPLNAGAHCRFCPAKTICPEISDAKFREAKIAFAPQEGLVELPVFEIPAALKLPELPKILMAIPSIKEWCQSVEDHAFQLLVKKTKIPGFKLVEKRAQRSWNTPDATRTEALKEFGDLALTTPELKTPAQLEKLGAKAKSFTKTRTVSVSSGLTMASANDPRPEATSAAEAFKDAPKVLTYDEVKRQPVSEDAWRKQTTQNKGRKRK